MKSAATFLQPRSATARIFAALLLLCAVPAQADPVTAADRLKLADGLFARELFDLAAREYESFIADFPQHAELDVILYRFGEALRRSEQRIKAYGAFFRVYNEFPKSEFAYLARFRRADLFMELEQYGAAAELFEELLALDPPADLIPSCRYYLAGAYVQIDKLDKARELYESLRRDFADNEFAAYATLQLGQLFEKIEDSKPKAMALYAELMTNAVAPRLAAEATFRTAEILFHAGKYAESAVAYNELLAKYPDDRRSRDAEFQAAWASFNSGRFADTADIVERVLARGTTESPDRWLYLLANSRRQLLDYPAAIAAYSTLLQRHPTGRYGEASLYERALCFFKRGAFAEAIKDAERVTDAAFRPDAYWILAESWSALGQAERATQYYRLIDREFPDSPLVADALYRLALGLQASGNLTEAAALFAALVERFPTSTHAPSALLAAGYCRASMKQDAEAILHFDRLLREFPESLLAVEALYRRGMSEIRAQRDEAALETLRALVEREPQGRFAAEANHWRGMLFWQAGKHEDAEGAFKRALSLNAREELIRESRFFLGVALKESGKAAESLDSLIPLLDGPARSRFTPALLVWMAERSFADGAFDKSLASATALTQTRGDGEAVQTGYALMGRALLALERRSEATAAWNRAIATEGATTLYLAEAHLRLGDMLIADGNFDAAHTNYWRAAELSGDDEHIGWRALAYAGLGRCAEAKGNFAEAARYYMIVAVLFDDPELVPECLYRARSAFLAVNNRQGAERAERELRARYGESTWSAKLDEQPPQSSTSKTGY